MWKSVNYQLKSVSPFIMHNGQLADPTNAFAKALKVITSKRQKTDEDYEAISQIEYFGSLYLNEKGPCVPALMLEACIVNAAKKTKDGKNSRMGMFVDKNFNLIYEGPKTREELYAIPEFVDKRMVVVKGRVLRTRPLFSVWGVTVEVNYDTDILNLSQINTFMDTAGAYIGLGEMRPKYGRFVVVK